MNVPTSQANKKIVSAAVLAGMFVVGAILGWIFGARSATQGSTNFTPLRSPESKQYHFINPLVGFDVQPASGFAELSSLKKDIQELYDSALVEKKIQNAGIYVRLLKNGHWFGVNEKTEFSPGSLLKVAVMIAYYKKAETDPDVLHANIQYQKNGLAPVPLANAAPSELTDGKKYTVEKLIEAMITRSDNGAKDVLIDALDPAQAEEIFRDIGFASINDAAVVSPAIYGNFFRRLYNSTLLSREYSEKALELLSAVAFSDGLRMGVPQDVPLAHKFGERGIYEDQHLVGVELHDCGIVYAKKNPYLICVMTSGADKHELANFIGTVSSMAYKVLSR